MPAVIARLSRPEMTRRECFKLVNLPLYVSDESFSENAVQMDYVVRVLNGKESRGWDMSQAELLQRGSLLT